MRTETSANNARNGIAARLDVAKECGDTVIDARGLSKRYGALAAVDDVSFSIGKGEVVGFLKPVRQGKGQLVFFDLGIDDQVLDHELGEDRAALSA